MYIYMWHKKTLVTTEDIRQKLRHAKYNMRDGAALTENQSQQQ